MENIKEFKEKINEVITVKNELDKEIDEFIEEYRGWSDIGETYGRILFFLSSGFSEKALDRINQNLFNNSVEGIIFHNHYFANYSLHKIHTLFPEAREKAIDYIAGFLNQEINIDFLDIKGRQGDKIPLPKEVKEFLNRFKEDIVWESGMSWYCDHLHSNYYQDPVEYLHLTISAIDLTTLKFVIDNIQSITKHRLDICCLDYKRLFKEKLCKN
ncbi:TPA: hypothetical protein I9089_002462 [Clostridium perfringens]|nr:hypothetical protein [Clostridium perfringens]